MKSCRCALELASPSLCQLYLGVPNGGWHTLLVALECVGEGLWGKICCLSELTRESARSVKGLRSERTIKHAAIRDGPELMDIAL